MELDFAILAEKADLSAKGLLQLFGGGLNQVNASDFPALSQLAIAARFIGTFDEAGVHHTVLLSITNPDGERKSLSEPREIQLSQLSADRHNFPAALVIFELMIGFASPGPYSFHISIDDRDVKELRISLATGGPAPVVMGNPAGAEVRQQLSK